VTRRIAVGMESAGLVHVRADSFPGRRAAHSGPRSARPEHRLRDALLTRGPCLNEEVWVPALRRSVKDAAPRPGHESLCPLQKTDKNCSDNKDGRFQSSSPFLGTIPAQAHDLAEMPENPAGGPARNHHAEAFTSL
jgi:hypothetical protein